MKKIEKCLLGFIGIMLYISTIIGINKILPFDKTGFFSMLIAFGIILYIIYLSSKEQIKIVQKSLNIAEQIYSLDYSHLVNISKIEIVYTESCEYQYQVYFKNYPDFHFSILEQKVPKNQEELELLDRQFDKINKNK